MSVFHKLRSPLVAIFALVMVVQLTSCSKKDVVSDEPAINPSDAGTAGGAGGVGSGNAGDAGLPSGDLQTVYFAFDSYSLSSETRKELKANGAWLKANPTAKIQIEGHCDERGTVEYNMALGDRRANAAKSFLSKMGIDKSRIDTISYGKERPSDSGHDEAAWSKNRRAVFVLLSK